MNNKAMYVVAFALGAAIGSLVTYKLLKTKYEQMVEQETKAAKEYYSDRRPKPVEPETTEQEDAEVIRDYTKIIRAYNPEYEPVVKDRKEESDVRKPYVISPDEFGEKDGYVIFSLTYYADGVLTDENDEPIDDIEGMIGKDALNSFGQYEDDSVFVRDDKCKIDYEILRDSERYEDLMGWESHRANEE